MSENLWKSTTQSGGIGFLGLLAILFIALKLTDHIDWPWLWVLAPIWAVPAILLTFIAGVFGVMGIAALSGNLKITRK